MQQLVWETAEELDQKLAQRVRNIRKRRSISQEKLASMSGVSYGSIKRFDTTGLRWHWIWKMNLEIFLQVCRIGISKKL